MPGKPSPTIYRTELGLRLKMSREKNFKTSKDCAEKYGVSPSMWTDMEKGRVVFSPEKIIDLAGFLHVDAGWLLTGRGADDSKKAANQRVEANEYDTGSLPELLGISNAIAFALQKLVAGEAQGKVAKADLLKLFHDIAVTVEKSQANQRMETPVKLSS